MKKPAAKPSFQPIASIFGEDMEALPMQGNELDKGIDEAHKKEQGVDVPLADLHPFQGHPYKVVDDDSMAELVNSILDNGVLYPALVRPRQAGGYELIAGHRRKRACELAGLDTMPVTVRQVDDDEAVILMVNSNLYRPKVLPSEKAFAYKMQMEAMNRQGARTSFQVGTKLRSDEIIGKAAGESRIQVHRYIRLTNLYEHLLAMVDLDELALNTGVELSHLRMEEQKMLHDIMRNYQAKPTLTIAKQMKQESQKKGLTHEGILAYFEAEPPGRSYSSIPFSKLRSYFPKSYRAEDMERVILRLLEQWSKMEKEDF